MRYVCFFAAAIFSLFTYWQFNDFEQYGTEFWYGWIVLYGATALLSVGVVFRPLSRANYLTFGVLAIVGAIVRATSINWNEPIFYNETNPAGNEAGGLLVVGCWLIFLAFAHIQTRGLSIKP